MKTVQGKGLLEQIENSNQQEYTQMTEKSIKKMMNDLSVLSTEKPRDKRTGKFLKGPRRSRYREYTMIVGQEFYNQFNKALEKEANKWTK